MGAGNTEHYLGAKGFENNKKLGADQIITNESLCFCHSELDGDR